MNLNDDSSLAALIGLLAFVLTVAVYVWTALALAAMFRKMGEETWKAWVPLLNVATLLRWGGFNPWWVLLVLFPPAAIVVWILVVISAHRINPGFGFGGGMTVLAALLFVVWASILGFGSARWLGARTAAWTPTTTDPARARAAAAPAEPAPTVVVGSLVPPVEGADAGASGAGAAGAGGAGAAGAGAAGAAGEPDVAFAPPVGEPSSWMPPETRPRSAGQAAAAEASGAGAAPASADAPWQAAPRSAAAGEDFVARGGAASDDDWPSEVDDVSAVYPSPFPPSAAAGGQYVAPPVTADEGPIAFVPGRRTGGQPEESAAPVTRVPAARATPPEPRSAAPVSAPVPTPTRSPEVTEAETEPAEPLEQSAPATPVSPIFPQRTRTRQTWEGADPDAFPELSGEVSAVIGAPAAGAPRSASGAVSAQHRLADAGAARDVAEDDIDATVIARRVVRATWELVPASGSPVPLTAPVVILGRRPSADAGFPGAQLVPVEDDARTVSKTHARIELVDGAWVITDLASTNGVLVRTLMGEEVEVEPGAQIDAGERFFLGDAEFHLRRLAP